MGNVCLLLSVGPKSKSIPSIRLSSLWTRLSRFSSTLDSSNGSLYQSELARSDLLTHAADFSSLGLGRNPYDPRDYLHTGICSISRRNCSRKSRYQTGMNEMTCYFERGRHPTCPRLTWPLRSPPKVGCRRWHRDRSGISTWGNQALIWFEDGVNTYLW